MPPTQTPKTNRHRRRFMVSTVAPRVIGCQAPPTSCVTSESRIRSSDALQAGACGAERTYSAGDTVCSLFTRGYDSLARFVSVGSWRNHWTRKRIVVSSEGRAEFEIGIPVQAEIIVARDFFPDRRIALRPADSILPSPRIAGPGIGCRLDRRRQAGFSRVQEPLWHPGPFVDALAR